MRTKLLVALFIGALILVAPKPLKADIPVLTKSGTLANAADVVTVGALVGQSTCTVQEVGTVGPIDVEGSIDGTNWTPLNVTDFSAATQAQPITPTSGVVLVTASTSVSSVRIRADATWSGQSATGTVRCSSSVARAGGGGGAAATLVAPIYSPSANHIGFDFTHDDIWANLNRFGGATSGAPCPSNTTTPGGVYIAGGCVVALDSDFETNASSPNDDLKITCRDGSDGFFYIGTNNDGPTAWTLWNNNSELELSTCHASSSRTAGPVNNVDVFSIHNRLPAGAYFQFNDVSFGPVYWQSAIGNGGCAQFNGTTGAIGSTGQPCGGVNGTCASIGAGGTACTFPNSYAFPDTNYICTLGVVGTTPTSTSYVATSTTQLTLYAVAGSPSVTYRCSE